MCICVIPNLLTTSHLRKIVFFSPWAPVFMCFATKFLGFGPLAGASPAFFLAIILTNLIRSSQDNIIKLTMYIINKFQTKITTNLLTNNYINIKLINNKLIIIKNPSNIDITKLLTKNFITFKNI